MKNVLFVITSHEDLGDTGLKTGFWTEELAAPYYALTDKGVQVTLCSVKGGQPPVDPKSNLPEFQTETTKRMSTDESLLKQLANTTTLSAVKVADYDAVFYPGGHGPLWDLANDTDSIRLITDFYNATKPVAFVCHAPGVLKNVRLANGAVDQHRPIFGRRHAQSQRCLLSKGCRLGTFRGRRRFTDHGSKSSVIRKSRALVV